MKKLIASLCAVLACSFLFTATPVQAKTTNYEMTLTKSYQRIWSNGTNKIYIHQAETLFKECEEWQEKGPENIYSESGE